jgi:hypothetical protein
VRLKGLDELKKSNDLIRIRARDLTVDSTEPQTTTIRRARSFNDNMLIQLIRTTEDELSYT